MTCIIDGQRKVYEVVTPFDFPKEGEARADSMPTVVPAHISDAPLATVTLRCVVPWIHYYRRVRLVGNNALRIGEKASRVVIDQDRPEPYQGDRRNMSRIQSDDTSDDTYVSRVFAAQAKRWGAPLLNHRVYARRPTIFRGVRAMWNGIAASGLIDEQLQALVGESLS